jgi:hypothetical protein
MALEPTRDATVRAKSSNGLLDAVSSKKRSRTAQPLTRQTLKYRSESRLTKCFTDDFEFGSDIYVLWCPMDLSSVWLGNKYMQCKVQTQINISTIWKSNLNLGNEFPNPTGKTWVHISSSLFIHYSDFPFNIRASSPGLGYILIYVGQCYS